MNDIELLLSGLAKTPAILSGLLSEIPEELLKTKRFQGRWTIHEHACHIASGDRIGFLDRLERFIAEERPVLVAVSGESFAPDYLQNMDLASALDEFARTRAELIGRAHSLEPSLWEKEAEHPEYVRFTPRIMLRHRLLHDNYHLYRIEELWLTRAIP